MDEGQSDEELRAHYGPGGPVAVAQKFANAVLGGGTLAEVWALVTADLRRDLAQAWVDANRGHPLMQPFDPQLLVEGLSAARPVDSLWPMFVAIQQEEFVEQWSNVDLAKWGWASRPRPIAPGRELVLLADAGGAGESVTVPGPMLVPALGFVMELGDDKSWRIAEFTEGDPPAPGPEGSTGSTSA